MQRWRDEAVAAGQAITRIAVAYEAGCDGFWLARWLRAHDIEGHVMPTSSIPVDRTHRRAKTDRLDAKLLLYQKAVPSTQSSKLLASPSL